MIADFVFEITSTTGTGPFTLGGARSANFRTFAQGYSVGDTMPYSVYGGGQFEVGKGTLTGPTTLARTEVYNGSAGPGVAVNFAAGNKDISSGINSGLFQNVVDLPASNTLADADRVMAVKADGSLATILGSIIKASSAGISPGDSTAPVFGTGAALASSNVTSGGFTLTWPAATDAVGVVRYEYSLDGGSTWTNAGNVLTVGVTGRTASTTYPTRLRALDAAGNPSTALALAVTTASSTDVTDPTMSGSLTTTAVTTSGYTMNWPAGADNVAVVGYDTSIDGGTTWTQQGNTLTRDVTGRPASTTDQLRVRARDAAGRTSNVLSATVTTAAAPVQTITVNNPGAETVGVAYTVSGAYTNGQPTALDYRLSDDPAGQWTPVTSPTIGAGVFSFSLTPATASAARTVSVRDRSTLVSGTSTAYAVNAAGPTMASLYELRTGFNTADISAPQPVGGTSPDLNWGFSPVRLNIKSSGGAVPLAADVQFVFGKKGNPCPAVFGGPLPGPSGNGNAVGHSNGVQTVSRLAGWTDSSSQYFGTLSAVGTLYAWGTAGVYVLFVMYRDGSVKIYDNGTGVPVEWNLA